MDPESLTLVMGRYFERTQAVLERHGGTVQKFIGDPAAAQALALGDTVNVAARRQLG